MVKTGDSVDWARSLGGAVGCALLYYLLASPAVGIEQSTTLSAIAWPAPTFMIALLWRKPLREWPVYLVAVMVAIMFVGQHDRLSVYTDAGFAVLNAFEVAACALVGRRFVARDGQLDTLRRLSRFLLLLPVGVIAVVAACGATLAVHAMHGNWWHEWSTLLVGNGLAILVLVPAFLTWSGAHGNARLLSLPSILCSLMVLCALLASVTFDLPEEVMRVMLSLALAGAALYGGMRSATLTMSTAAVLAVLLTLYDLGPYRQDGLDSTLRLQIDLAGYAMLTFFIAVAMRERQALTLRMEQMRRFESLGLMAGSIAHDFNNVLGAAGGYAELAAERLPAESPAQVPLREVCSAVARGRDLTEQILLAGRRGDRQRALLDLRAPVDEAVRLARPLCREGIHIFFTPPEQALPVRANGGQITRVALNLIRNASLAARREVRVSLHHGQAEAAGLMIGEVPPEEAVWLEVTDDGAGIAKEHLARLFEPFFTTRGGPGGKGTGLGLAIVAGIATEHDGGVAVLTSHEGTVFRLLLPVESQLAAQWARSADADAAQTPSSPISSTGEVITPLVPSWSGSHDTASEMTSDDSTNVMEWQGQGQSVFLVDDDPALRPLYQRWLSGMGMEPIGFADPVEALNELTIEPRAVDLLVTDLDMPQISGEALIVQARALRADLPVLLCSGNHARLDEMGRQHDLVTLRKPFNEQGLRRAVQAALRKTEEEQE